MVPSTLRDVKSTKEKIFLIERRELDGAVLQFPSHIQFLSEFNFIRLFSGLQYTDPLRNNNRTDDLIESLFTGMYAINSPFCYIIDSHPDKTNIYFGSKTKESNTDMPAFTSIIEGYWGQQCLQRDDTANHLVRKLDQHQICGAITGIPSGKPLQPSVKKTVFADNLLKALQGERWTYMVNGFCIQRSMLADYENQILSEIALLKTQTIRDDILYEEKRFAEHYQAQLETCLKRFQSGKISGTWQAGVYFFSENEYLIHQGLGLVSAFLAGKRPSLQPIRVHICRKDKTLNSSFCNYLTSSELSQTVSIPEEEIPGFALSPVAAFDSDTSRTGKLSEPISIGNVVRNNIVTTNKYEMELADLTRHALVAGVTGSGKTTTCFHLLRQLQERKIPFMVIESAKSEYRQLLNDPVFRNMLVFTLGDESIESSAPFRMNPFEVPAGVLVQTHLDFLKSLFKASFVLYAPMPYVLEEALHAVYSDRGWNLSTNTNERGTGEMSFPTLTDLYEKIDEIVSRLGYDDRISRDIIAGLKTRINNLRLGGKGLMFDTQRSMSVDDLMKRPVLLELKKLGNDDEKAFFMGLILTRIYEYYESDSDNNPYEKGLKHLTLIEEAHRLLKYVPPDAAEMDGNVRGKAVETFCNILSEIRVYGEGVVVSEQIPDKLARDVMKNSNLKIMHRMVARDDRDIMGATMNMNDEQKNHAVAIERGRAVVFAEGMDNPMLVHVPITNVPNGETNDHRITNRFLYQHMQTQYYGAQKGMLFKYPECKYCPVDRRLCEQNHESIRKLLHEAKAREQFNRLFFSTGLFDFTPSRLKDIEQTIRESVSLKGKDEMKSLIYCFIIQGLYLQTNAQGRLYGYSFPQTAALIETFTEIARHTIFSSIIKGKAVEKFKKLFLELRTKPGRPYTGCIFCDQGCVYRFEISGLLRDNNINADFNFIIEKTADDYEMWMELAQLCKKNSLRILTDSRPDIMQTVALCYLAQKVAANGYSPKYQEMIVRNIQHVYEKGKVTF